MTSINNISSTQDNYYYNTSATTQNTSTAQTADKNATAKKSATSYSNKTSLGNYLNSVSPDKADAKEIFKNLSLDVGGDGKSITKDQLSSYIDKAENGNGKVPDKELNALKTLQDNWSKVADGGDKITYASVYTSGYTSTLKSMAPDSTSKTKDVSSDFTDSKTNINNKLISSALGTSTSSSSSTNYYSMLKTLLSGTTDENDDSNAEAIAALTNLIANFKSTSTVETKA